MSTAIRDSMADDSTRDNTGDTVDGADVNANDNTLADVMDGTTAVRLAGAGELEVLFTSAKYGFNLINIDAAAAAIHDAICLEWDPASGNMTDGSSGIGMVWKFPDDANAQKIMARIDVIVDDDAAGSEDTTIRFQEMVGGTLTTKTFGTAAFTEDVTIADTYGLVVGGTSQQEISDGDGATNVIPEVQELGTAAADMTALIGGWSTTATRAAAPTLALLKSGNAAIGSHTVVTDDEILGSIIAYGDDGTDYESPAAAIEFAVDGTPGTGDMPGRIAMYTTPDGGETLAEVLRLDSTGAITMPKQVSFATKQASYQTNATGDGTWATVDFGTEKWDTGGNLSGTTFTAPVTGKYDLKANIESYGITSSHTICAMRIQTSNESYSFANMHLDPISTTGDIIGITGSVLADMDLGDTAIVGFYVTGSTKTLRIETGGITRFMGHLLS